MKSLKDKLIYEMKIRSYGYRSYFVYSGNELTFWVGDGNSSGSSTPIKKFKARLTKNSLILDNITKFFTNKKSTDYSDITNEILSELENNKKTLTSFDDNVRNDVYEIDVYSTSYEDKTNELFKRIPSGVVYMLVTYMITGDVVINFFSTIQELKGFSGNKKFKKV